MLQGNADVLAICFIIEIEHSYGRFGNDRRLPGEIRLLQEEELPSIEAIALSKIMKLINREGFIESPSAVTVLHVWKELEPDEAKRWSDNAFSDMSVLMTFLQHFIWTQGIEVMSLYDDRTKIFIDLDELRQRLETASQDDSLSEEHRSLAQEYIARLKT
jgi:hypothetical protein